LLSNLYQTTFYNKSAETFSAGKGLAIAKGQRLVERLENIVAIMPQAQIRWMAVLRSFLLGVIASRCIDSYMSPLRSHRLRLQGPSIYFPAYSSPPSKSDMEQARSDESRSLQSCCDEDFCFPEPPSTDAGNSNEYFFFSTTFF
jgi:hypothetical protein